MLRGMRTRTELAIVTLMERHGPGTRDRLVRVHVDTGNVLGDSWHLELDGVRVWSMRWEEVSETEWRLVDEWIGGDHG
jgi:hypothetical protein